MVKTPILIYDGDCAFCSTTIRLISRVIKTSPEMQPFQWTDLKSIGLTLEECVKEVQFVISLEEKYSGARAFAEFFENCKKPWKYLGSIMKMPIIRKIADVIYRLVAKNRYRLPGGTPTCGLPKNN